MGLYFVMLPLILIRPLVVAKRAGTIDTRDVLQSHGWLLVKFRTSAWYAEFIFVYYRVFVAFVVGLFGGPKESVGTLLTMMVATTIVLAFVVLVKPYEGSDESTELPNNHRMHVVALSATLVAFVLGLISLAVGPEDTDGRSVADVVISLLISLVVIVPMIYTRMCPGKARTIDESNMTENPMANVVGTE
jgi:hypothetical protein